MAEVFFTHTLEYPDNHNITLSEIAATLIAQERLIPVALDIFEAVYLGLMVESYTISLEYARHGSLTEDFLVAILVVYQKGLDHTAPDLVDHINGGHIPDQHRSIVSVLQFLVLYYGMKGNLASGNPLAFPICHDKRANGAVRDPDTIWCAP